jgi:acetate CoA/acetoacetate CoA-transferase alpha subunit
MIDKTTPLQEAVARIRPGSRVMVGGFGSPGTPMTLLRALLEQGTGELTVIKNEANEPGVGVSLLIEAGRVRRMVLSHLGLNTRAIEMMNKGELEVEFHPQGILAEKIRCGGAGLLAFVTDIGVDTIIRDSRRTIQWEGREAILEPALRADVALVHAARADRGGNLAYAKSARNFNPLMAMAADLVIAEAAQVLDTGALDPDAVHTPAAFVDHVVDLGGNLSNDYGVLEHHVLA